MAADTTDAMADLSITTADAASDSSSNSITACKKGLAIPHILKGVICDLPPLQILQAKAVCKTWYTTINNSEQIFLATIAHPTGTTFQAGDGELQQALGHTCCTPCYPGGSLSLHPAFKVLVTEQGYKTFTITHYTTPRPTIEDYYEDFVTIPPCSAVGMQVNYMAMVPTFRRVKEHCIVYVPTGVTIGDLLDVAEKLKWHEGHLHESFLGTCGQMALN